MPSSSSRRAVSAPRKQSSATGDVKLSGVEPGNCIDVQQAPERLAVRTIPVADPGDLVARFPESAGVAWVRHGDGLVGWGETARITLPAGEDRFTAGEKWLRALFDGAHIDDQVGEPGCGLVAFGSFTFDSASDGSVLVVPAAIVGRRHGRSWLTTIAPAAGPVPRSPGCHRWPRPGGPAGHSPRLAPPVPAELRWHDGGLSAPDWERAVAAAVTRIRAGHLRKVVLARDLYATASEDIDITGPAAAAGRPLPRLLHLRLRGPGRRHPRTADPPRRTREISSLVLGGTVPRGRGRRRGRPAGRRPPRLGQGTGGTPVRGGGRAVRARRPVRLAGGGTPARRWCASPTCSTWPPG